MTMSVARRIATMGLGLLGSALSSAASSPARAQLAPDVVVFCEPTLKYAIADVAALWRKETGVPVRIFTSRTWALIAEMPHARDDLVIGEGEANIAAASARHTIKPETVQRLWRNRLVVAARGPGPRLA